jgi:general secretion pathway protein L
MSMLGEIGTAFSLWIDAVAGIVKSGFERFETARRIEVVESDDGTFTIRSPAGVTTKPATLSAYQVRIVEGTVTGLSPEWAREFRDSRVQLMLRPSRFLLRPLDLPSRATEFLEGIIRAQIDRLTPWSANDAVFRWTTPIEEAGGRISMTIVATARAMVLPLAQAIADLGAAVVEVSTAMPGREAVPVTVHCLRTRAKVEFGRIRFALLTVFAVTGFVAITVVGVAGFATGYYDDQKQQVQRRIAERRAMIRAGQVGTGNTVLEILERRKHTTPSSVMVIEALSEILPDHTYTTELRIEGDKVQIVGITRDAPSLIQLLEQSPHFARATFFAPTTRAPNNPGERFHIEARIRPHFGSAT